MIFVIDYRLAASSLRGMARYCREITIKLLPILPKEWKIILYVDKNKKKDLIPNNILITELPTRNFIVGEQILIPYFLKHDQADILWSPYNTFPLLVPRKTKRIATIHDLIFMNKSNDKQTKKQAIGRIYRRLIIKLGIQKLDGCCTVSKFTYQELIKLPYQKKIALTYNCIDSFAEKVTGLSLNNHYIRNNIFFTVSGDAPSKNISMLLNWFKEHNDYKLQIAGIPNNSPLRQKCPTNVTILPPNLSDEELIKYYMTCRAFLFVSKQEGFGIPLLEAMICKCKLIISNRTSIPEIVGDNGLYINPDDPTTLTKAIYKIDKFNINEQSLQKQIKKFLFWEDSAKNLASLLETILTDTNK